MPATARQPGQQPDATRSYSVTLDDQARCANEWEITSKEIRADLADAPMNEAMRQAGGENYRMLSLYGHLDQHIREADSYFLTSDFLELVCHATETLDPQTVLLPEDFPGREGWISFQDVPGDIAGFYWTLDMVHGHASLILDVAGHLGTWSVHLGETPEGGCECEYLLADAAIWSDGKFIEGATFWDWAKILKSAWLLMKQIAETTETPAARPYRRRAATNHVRPTIRIVRLPRTSHAHTGAHSTVEWKTRWIVSGHWRNQPYGPERKSRRATWISPHIKGPDGLPVATPAHRLFVADKPKEAAGTPS